MNHKLLLVKSITLLYRENQLPENREKSSDLVRTILSNIKVNEVNLGINQEADVLNNLKETALSMCEDSIDVQYEQTDILQRLKLDCQDDESTYDALKEAIIAEMSDSSIKRTCVNIRRQLHSHFKEEEAISIINKAAQVLRFQRDKVKDFKAFLLEHIQTIEPFTMDAVGAKDPAIVSDVDLADLAAVQNVFKEVKTMDDGTGIMKTGWQCVNRMTRGGLRRGEEVAIGALQHNFKTGFSLSLFTHVAILNEPYMVDPKKKPLLLRISFEDDITLNMQFIYTYLKENETGVKVENLEEISDNEMSEYVMEKLTATGYHVKLMRVNPSLWTYSHICNKILELEAEGYEIHLLMLDYLYLVPTTGCSQGPAGHDVRDLFRRMRNFCNPRKITLVTPHQLSSAAKQLIRDGADRDFVKDIANRGYWAGTTQLDQEIDLEIIIHIVKFNGYSWLTIQRGKHRIPGITKPEDLFCVMRFQDIGTIPMDINGLDTSTTKVGGTPIGNGTNNPNPFWDD